MSRHITRRKVSMPAKTDKSPWHIQLAAYASLVALIFVVILEIRSIGGNIGIMLHSLGNR